MKKIIIKFKKKAKRKINDELEDIIQKIKSKENKTDDLSEEKNTVKEDKVMNNIIGYNLENASNTEKVKENEIENNKNIRRKYQRREIGEKND